MSFSIRSHVKSKLKQPSNLYIYIYVMSIFTFRDTPPTTRGHQYKVIEYPVHYNARTNFFPAELLTCGITYHLVLSKHHH